MAVAAGCRVSIVAATRWMDGLQIQISRWTTVLIYSADANWKWQTASGYRKVYIAAGRIVIVAR